MARATIPLGIMQSCSSMDTPPRCSQVLLRGWFPEPPQAASLNSHMQTHDHILSCSNSPWTVLIPHTLINRHSTSHPHSSPPEDVRGSGIRPRKKPDRHVQCQWTYMHALLSVCVAMCDGMVFVGRALPCCSRTLSIDAIWLWLLTNSLSG